MDIDVRRYVSNLWTRITDASSKDATRDIAQKLEQLARDLKAVQTDSFPVGALVFWLGTAADIPAGWEEATEMRSRFPRGMASGGTPGITGGSSSHGHSINGSLGPSSANVGVASGSSYQVAVGTHTHSVGDLGTTSASSLPPYVDGIWIRKL